MDDFKVHDEKIEERLKDLGNRMRSACEGTGYGFALLLFSFGEGGNMFYTSNAQRDDIVNAMREFIEKVQ